MGGYWEAIGRLLGGYWAAIGRLLGRVNTVNTGSYDVQVIKIQMAHTDTTPPPSRTSQYAGVTN